MTADVVIIGGGLAGSAAAITLAASSRNVILIEREPHPAHKVCGEFLSREALAYLHRLGIDADALGAVPIERVRLAGHSGVTEATLPFPAKSLTRRTLDEALLHAAHASGARLLRGNHVEALHHDGTHWRASLRGRTEIAASEAFLATGKHDLRGRARPAGKQRDLIGLKMYFKLAPREAAELEGHVELMLYAGGYAGLQPVEDGWANLCCLVSRATLQRIGGRWNDLLALMQRDCPHLRQRLRGAAPMLAKPLAIAAIPYGHVLRRSDGLWALGDQAAVIPSFTGDGMSIALHSGILAAQMLLAGQPAHAYQQRLSGEVHAQVALATTLSRAMVRRPQRALLEMAARFWPGVMRLVAERTRIPAAALLT